MYTILLEWDRWGSDKRGSPFGVFVSLFLSFPSGPNAYLTTHHV